MLQIPNQTENPIEKTWSLFKQRRTSVEIYTENATVVYVPTFVGVRGNTKIRKFFLHPHFSQKTNTIKETVFNTLVSRNKLIEESIWSIQFNSGECDWLVPGIDEGYLLNSTVKFPVTASVSFVDSKIESIRYLWDQACVLKQLKVISSKTSWPITGECQIHALSSLGNMHLRDINGQQDEAKASVSTSSVPSQFLPGRIFGPVDPKHQVVRPVRHAEPDTPPIRNIFTYNPPKDRPLVAPQPDKLSSSIILGQEETGDSVKPKEVNRVAGKPTPRVYQNIIG
ncbi:hypothetical protein BY458DRAFT_540583 [Sporodiniella umbellata]|nr:hypothetical protein BY458DRAFT_540583 [Sporodiniella umbellata]